MMIRENFKPSNLIMKVLSINYCEGEDDDVMVRLVEFGPHAMHIVHEKLKKHNVVHLNVLEMTIEELQALKAA